MLSSADFLPLSPISLLHRGGVKGYNGKVFVVYRVPHREMPLAAKFSDFQNGGIEAMKKNWKTLTALCCLLALLFGMTTVAQAEKSEHEPLTICIPNRDVASFIEVVHKYYPEINFEVIPYSGGNATAFVSAMLEARDITDIYSTSVYTPGQQDLSDTLIDLSSYAFTNNYYEARLHELMDGSKLYFVPTYYTAFGMTVNTKIFEENGWEIPTSLKEVEALKPLAEEKGYKLALNQLGLPGYGFQYMCNIMDTGYLSTLGGRKWQSDFLTGKTTLADSPEMLECIQLVQRWYDLGLLGAEDARENLNYVRDEMAEGNTLFMLGASNEFQKYGEEVYESMSLMPYLSEDGDQNVYVVSVSSYVGLSKKLQEPGNEQKLQDALHVMEVLSTVEGMRTLNRITASSSMLPLKEAPLSENNYYADPRVSDEINAGFTAPFIYAGWDSVIVDLGNVMLDYIEGKCELQDVITRFDEDQKMITENKVEIYTTVTEKIDTADCARINGIAFAKAVGADAALVSYGTYSGIEGDLTMNNYGVSGCLFPLPLDEQKLSAITQTSWNGTIRTMTLTGARIKELAATGYAKTHRLLYASNDPADKVTVVYPYVLVTRDDMPLDDDTVYTIVYCGVTSEVMEEGNAQDTGVNGLQVMKDYMRQFETFSKADIHW